MYATTLLISPNILLERLHHNNHVRPIKDASGLEPALTCGTSIALLLAEFEPLTMAVYAIANLRHTRDSFDFSFKQRIIGRSDITAYYWVRE